MGAISLLFDKQGTGERETPRIGLSVNGRTARWVKSKRQRHSIASSAWASSTTEREFHHFLGKMFDDA
jgi:hypothetical protein